MPDAESLNDAQVFILQAVQHSQHLYPASVKKSLGKYSKQLAKLNDDNEPSSETLQQLVAYDHYLEGLLSLLVLCRRYDQANKKPQCGNDDHQEGNND